LRLLSRGQTVEYRDWTAQLKDANLDGGASLIRAWLVIGKETMIEPDSDPVPTAVRIY